ncbi:MAG: radical SAM protein [Candidatus Fischerbacteria bacterium RBG_13_37_8]|uniref:Radical SAM protein n=1 Tax=Candidatus Fischerbacteria bacterium RBG_13_37_8 TaxID=1817863 RepID=A0A1F5V628_9BACT|nr:MAG: radical SAM protein [Candidatus Fischerbacteria bacterium RBG_13_37_8]
MNETPEEKIQKAYRLLAQCVVCPRTCRAKRVEGKKGDCKVSGHLIISSVGPHHGEENCLSGWRGSGTIFFSGCNLGCIFCQNYTISHMLEGSPSNPAELAQIMLKLQNMGCHNINFVTPTHFLPHILEAIILAKKHKLSLPIVWNCGGYESVAALKLLEGFVDIYMPDLKFSSPAVSEKLVNTKYYFVVAKKAIMEMHRQVGDLVINEQGLATKGLMIRHLVLPNNLAGTEECLSFLFKNISPHTYVNIMDQYRPCYHAFKHASLSRRISTQEYYHAITFAKNIGLHRGF